MAASTGIVGATVVTMGILSLPLMLKWNYNKKNFRRYNMRKWNFRTNNSTFHSISLLADIFQGANEQASQISGDLAPNPVSSVDLFCRSNFYRMILIIFYTFWIFLWNI